MVENKSSLFGIIALIIGASGLGLGAFSVVNFQLVEGPQGLPGDDGQDGTDGEDAPGGLMVGLLDPNNGEVVSGEVIIRALIYGSINYSISILRNSTLIGTVLPLTWDTTAISDGWWNITITIKDTLTLNESSDSVIVYIDNVKPNARVYRGSDYSFNAGINSPAVVDFDDESYDPENCFNLTTDRYTAQKEGYYLITTQVTMVLVDGEYLILILLASTGHSAIVLQYAGATGYISPSITEIIYLYEGSYIELLIGHNAGVNRDLRSGRDRTFMTIANIS